MHVPRVRLPRPTYAGVTATLALVIATSMGGAYAVDKIGSGQIKNNAVKSRHIAAKAVKTPDLGKRAVNGSKLRSNAVTGSKVKNKSLSSKDLAPRAAGLVQAAAKVTGAGTVQTQFNRLGGPVTASNTSAGNYALTIPGATGGTFEEKIVNVTAHNSLAECKPWLGQDESVTVICVRSDNGNFLNATFSLSLIG